MSQPSFGKSIPIDLDSMKTHKIGLPMFICGRDGRPSSVHIYTSHYERMQAVIAAARSGNMLLMKIALAHHDECDSNA